LLSFNYSLKPPDEITTRKFESNAANTTLAILEVEKSSEISKETTTLTSSDTTTTSEIFQENSTQAQEKTTTMTSTSTSTTTTVKICFRMLK
jgi:hypothetical protein